jgi:cellulose synthase/poly-beta-1,6-N-acetylglucosamine synthase-like glycosyltransferase
MLICSIILISLFFYPYIFYPISLMMIRKNSEITRGSGDLSASLLFCAFNEERSLPEKLENVRKLKARHPDLEILAYDDGSTDRTHELLRAHEDQLAVVRGPGRQGKAAGMKLLAARAKGDILVFTDANVILDVDAIANVRCWFDDPSVGGVCGVLQYSGDAESSTAYVGGRYWRLEEKIKALESATGNVMGADGSIFAIRRSLYPDFPTTVLDDLTVSMECVFRGLRLIRAHDVVAYERLVSSSKDEFARKVRIASRAYHTHLYLRSRLKRMSPVDRYKYISHRLVRWWGGPLLLVGTVLMLIGVALLDRWAGLYLLLFAIAGGVFIAFSRSWAASNVREILLAIIATSLGVWRALLGRTYVTWSPAQSR